MNSAVLHLDQQYRIRQTIRTLLSSYRFGPGPHRRPPHNSHVAGPSGFPPRIGRTDVQTDDAIVQSPVIWAVPRFGEIVFLVELLFLDKWQKEHPPAVHRLSIRVGHVGGRIAPIRRVIRGQSVSNLPQTVATLGPSTVRLWGGKGWKNQASNDQARDRTTGPEPCVSKVQSQQERAEQEEPPRAPKSRVSDSGQKNCDNGHEGQ